MEKMLFSGVQSNSEVALIAIKGIKNQPGIAAKVFGAIAEEKINVELILQSIGRGENKDISFVVAQDEADHAVETLKKAFDEADYEDIISDKEVFWWGTDATDRVYTGFIGHSDIFQDHMVGYKNEMLSWLNTITYVDKYKTDQDIYQILKPF